MMKVRTGRKFGGGGYRLLREKGYSPIHSEDGQDYYQIVLAPYDNEICRRGECCIRYRYSVVTKPEFSYQLSNVLPFDYILCYGEQDEAAFNAYSKSVVCGYTRAKGFKHKNIGGKKRILYAPTYRAGLDFQAIAKELALLKNTYHITLKLHPGSKYLDDEREVVQILQESCSEYIDGDQDIMSILESTDLLITDYSGAAFDAMAVDIPAALIRVGDSKTSVERDGSVLNHLILDEKIACCYHEAEIRDTIEKALSEQMMAEQKKAAKRLFSISPEEGKEVFIDLIKSIIANGLDGDYRMERRRLERSVRLLEEKGFAQEEKIIQLRKQLEEKSQKEEQYQNIIREMSSSTSWKLTKPLRYVGRVVRRILSR